MGSWTLKVLAIILQHLKRPSVAEVILNKLSRSFSLFTFLFSSNTIVVFFEIVVTDFTWDLFSYTGFNKEICSVRENTMSLVLTAFFWTVLLLPLDLRRQTPLWENCVDVLSLLFSPSIGNINKRYKTAAIIKPSRGGNYRQSVNLSWRKFKLLSNRIFTYKS
jgi:hypothetical protein